MIDNLLLAQTKIMTRLTGEVSALAYVGSPSLAAFETDIIDYLPLVFVVPGNARPTAQKANKTMVSLEQVWRVILVVAHQPVDDQNASTEMQAGLLMTAVVRALSGYNPDSDYYRSGLAFDGYDAPSYELGYAEFEMNFSGQLIAGLTA